MKKTLIIALCVLLASILLFCSCSKETTGSDKSADTFSFSQPQYHWEDTTDQTLTVWGDETDLERSYLTKAFTRYEKMTGNTLNLIKLSKEELEQKVPEAFANGSNDPPDILLSPGGRTLDSYDPDQNFYDFTKEPWVKDLTNTSINQTIYNGKVIGLPFWEASISGTLYNKQLFETYDIEIPKNQEEFLAVCKTLNSHGVTPMYLPYAEISMLLYQFPMDSICQTPGTLESLNDGTLSYSMIPEMKKIISWYKTMSDSGYFGQHYEENNWAGMDEALKSNDYAMMLCWDTWLYSDFTGNPDHFGLMPAFMGVPEEGCFEGPNPSLFLVNKNSPHLQGALNFITFMADPYNYNAAFEGLYTAPVFKNQMKSISTPQYIEAERLVEQHFYDSTARLRIQGFSQMDASYIQKHMRDSNYTVEDCLRDMDSTRIKRGGISWQK